MNRRLVAVLAVCAMWLGILAACQPTGHPRCDQQLDVWGEIDAAGWDLDCTPDFPNRGGQGQTILGWADSTSRTVYVWPEVLDSNAKLRKTLWHELAHVYGITDEADAERYSYCRDPQEGVGYRLAAFPTAADCERLGA